MIQEPFAKGRSFLHRADPRLKVVLAGGFSLIVALTYDFTALTIALFYAILMVVIARLNFGAVARRLLALAGFLGLLWLVLPLTFSGETLFSMGPIPFYRQGLILAAQISLKSAAILLALIALITTMTVATLGATLNRLGVPLKLVALLLMTYRYIFVITHEFERLANAAKIRAFKPGTNLHTYKTLAYFVGMLFVQAVTRARRVHNAMRCRGFKGRFYTLYEFLPLGQNKLFIGAIALILSSLIWLEWI
jgi:cobalt/nickel transport system permease protein